MYKRITVFLGQSLILLLIFYSTVFSAASGSLKGTISDAKTNNPLPYSNVILLGTSFGSSADKDGQYIVKNIPPGNYKLRASYVGYKQEEISIDIIEGKTTEYDISLNPETIEGETVVVTAQAEGQMKAINEQLSSIPIKNVVSLAKIQELPDMNAAESVSRLPGVSLIRTGGEGSQVVIRGLSPQYNQITIDGMEIPSDVASNNNITSTDKGTQESSLNELGDRGTDLSMISSSMLGGIEVIKAITPDMDATLIGGVVNFGLRKATKNMSLKNINAAWLPLIEITTQGGYNNLKDKYNNYKFVGSVQRRFFDEKFGAFVEVVTEQRNLSANELGADYQLLDKTHGDAGVPDLVSLNLADVFRERKRFGTTVVLDYQHDKGEIAMRNFFSTSDTKAIHRAQEIRQTSNDVWYSAEEKNNTLDVLSNYLSVKQDFSIFHADFKLAHSYSESKNPEDLFFNFWQDDAGLANLGSLAKQPPKVLASYVVTNDTIASLDRIETSKSISKERAITSSLDLQTDITIFNNLTAKVKIGGSYQYRKRTYDYNQSSGSQLYSGGGNIVQAFISAYPDLILNGGRLSFLNFSHDSYSYGNFLDGEYTLAYPINVDLMWKLLPIAKRTSSLEGYQVNKIQSAINDYSGNEKKSAAYLMTTFNIGDYITFLPGIRYQNLTTTYTALRGETVPNGIQGADTTITRSHGYFLPMVHLRYKPLDWFQIHFAYTNTLNYPDYGAITPRYLIGTGYISYNNWQLKPARSENFDIVASVYMNEVGLFSVDGFKKRIKDLIFFSKTYLTDLSAYPDLPQGRNILYEFNTYINNPIPIDVYGVELEWQTRFWYLPSLFSGVVFNINYTHIFSEASYPKTTLINEYDEQGNLIQTITSTPYKTRLLNQPNDVLNLSMGYDYGGFSGRISMLYQDNIFKKPDFWMQNRTNSAKFTRWDLSIRQILPWYGIQVFFNMSNITGEKDIDINQKNLFPASEQHYGMSADLGLRLRL